MRKIVLQENRLLIFNKKLAVSSELFLDIKAGKWGQFVFPDKALGQVKMMTVRVAKQAKCDIFFLIRKLGNVACQLNVELAGDRALANISGIFHGQTANRHNFRVAVHHHAQATKSDILIKGVYEKKAQAAFFSRIKIDQPARGSDANFASRILLLDRAAASTQPTMEIDNKEVRAYHSATTSRLDPLQIFYLRSRGLSPLQSRQAIIHGFFRQILPRLTPEINNSVKI